MTERVERSLHWAQKHPLGAASWVAMAGALGLLAMSWIASF